MGYQNQGYHYGLDFVLGHTDEQIASAVAHLAKRNRVTMSEAERSRQRQQLQERTKVRNRKATARRRRYFK